MNTLKKILVVPAVALAVMGSVALAGEMDPRAGENTRSWRQRVTESYNNLESENRTLDLQVRHAKQAHQDALADKREFKNERDECRTNLSGEIAAKEELRSEKDGVIAAKDALIAAKDAALSAAEATKEELRSEKDGVIAAKDALIAAKDAALSAAEATKEELRSEKDGVIAAKDALIAAKDAALSAAEATKEELRSEKDGVIAEKDALIVEKDLALTAAEAAKEELRSEKDGVIAEKDALIAAKDAEISRLSENFHLDVQTCNRNTLWTGQTFNATHDNAMFLSSTMIGDCRANLVAVQARFNDLYEAFLNSVAENISGDFGFAGGMFEDSEGNIWVLPSTLGESNDFGSSAPTNSSDLEAAAPGLIPLADFANIVATNG